MAGRGASSCARACNSTTAMASSPPRTWCTTMPCGVTRNTRAAKIHLRVATRNGICLVQRIEVVNDHEIVMHCKVVCLDLPFYYSSASNVMMFSKAQWDKEGEMGYETKPAGTGPYIFKERAARPLCAVRTCPDAALEARRGGLERAPDDLDARRTDALWHNSLAGETHLTEVNKDLVDEVVTKGHKLIRSRQVAQQIRSSFRWALLRHRGQGTRGATPNTVGSRGNWTRKCPGPT